MDAPQTVLARCGWTAGAEPPQRLPAPAPHPSMLEVAGVTASVVGQTIEVGEEDYMYGLGRLTLEVTEELDRVNRNGELWLRLGGHELWRDGTNAGWRTVLVRAAAIKPRA